MALLEGNDWLLRVKESKTRFIQNGSSLLHWNLAWNWFVSFDQRIDFFVIALKLGTSRLEIVLCLFK